MKKYPLYLNTAIAVCTLFFACSGSKSLTYNITSEAQCAQKGGYWYKGKCWRNYEDEGIDNADIDRIVDEQMVKIKKADVKIDGNSYPLSMFMPIPQGEDIILLTMFEDEEGTVTVYQTAKLKEMEKKGKVVSEAVLIRGNLMEVAEQNLSEEEMKKLAIGKGNLTVTMRGEMEEISISGNYTDNATKASKQISYTATEDFGGGGTSTMEVKGNEIHINGDLGTRSYYQLRKILREHPQVKTAVLGNISGSVNDAVNMHTGRILREAGLNTKVLKDSEIASGGVDLFCAGVERIVEKGAKLGIHSWCCVGNLTAVDIPKAHPAHQYQIEYFTMCLGEKMGPDFYFHTLEAAPFDDVHWMSEEEMKEWNVVTSFRE